MAEVTSLSDVVAAEARKERRATILRWALVPILVGAGVAAYLHFKPKPIAESAKYQTAAVTRGEVVHTVSATGRLESRRTVQVGAEISGRIQTVEVDFDDKVTAGQVMLRFDQDAIKAQVAQVRAQLRAAEAAVVQAEIDAAQTQRELDRSTQLVASGADSESRREVLQAQLDASKARINSARAQVDLQRASFALASTSLTHTIVRAPIDGVVISRNVEPGQAVAAALQAPVLFLLAADLREMRVLVAIDEADVGVTKPGQRAAFTVDAYPNDTFSAELHEIRSAPTITQGVVTYEAVLYVDNAELKLKPGMTASVKVRTEATPGALRVPNAALRFSLPTDAGKVEEDREGARVWVVSPEGPKTIEVSAGVTDGSYTAVIAEAIHEGTQVIVDLTADGRKAFGLDDKRK